MTQGERYDPDAEYIKRYVPELRGLDADLIHEWHELSPTQRARTRRLTTPRRSSITRSGAKRR